MELERKAVSLDDYVLKDTSISSARQLNVEPAICHARDLINVYLEVPEQQEVILEKLAALNKVNPGLLTAAITHNSLLEKNIGTAFDTFLPWVEVLGAEKCTGLKNYTCTELSESWRDTLPGQKAEAVGAIVENFTEKIRQSGRAFWDNPKVHLEEVRHSGDTATFVTRPALYSEIAAISHTIGNALIALSRTEPGVKRDEAKDKENIHTVLKLLSQLGVSLGTDGIDFSLGESQFPHTLGVNGIVLTADGYILQAQQGKKNMTSGGDFVPAISGSADPVEGTKATFDPLSDILREGAEEQGQSGFAFCRVIGVYQSLHPLGKPEVVVLAVLNDTLLDVLSKQRDAGGESLELAKRVSTATYVGAPISGMYYELGDSLQGGDKVANNQKNSGHPFSVQLEPAGRRSILSHVTDGGLENHVTQLVLAAGLSYLQEISREQT